MRNHWLYNKNNSKLIVFFSGWSMDHHPLEPLPSETFDVLVYYDYREVDFNYTSFQDIISAYQEVYLVAWSMGVFMSNHIFQDHAGYFTDTIAVNGTLQPVDDTFGIPVKAYDESILHYTEMSRQHTYETMCGAKEVWDIFKTYQPERIFADQKEELIILRDRALTEKTEHNVFKNVIISTQDSIISYRNQMRFWKDRAECHVVKTAHVPWYNWKTWEEFITYATQK